MSNYSLEKYQQSQYQYKNNVVLCNLLDKDFFIDFYKESKILKEFEEEGKKTFPFFEYLIEDLFYTLYKIVITVKEEKEIVLEVKTHRIVIDEILKAPNIKNLRRRTKGNLVHSYNALHYYLQWFLEFIEEEGITQLLEERKELIEEANNVEDELKKQEQKKKEIEEEIENFEKPCPMNETEEIEEIEKPCPMNEEENSQQEQNQQNEQQVQAEEGKIEAQEGQGDSPDDAALQEGLDSEEYQEGQAEDVQESVAGKGEDPSSNNVQQNNTEIDSSNESNVEELQLNLKLISKKIEEYQDKLQELKKEDQVVLEEYEKKLQEQNMEEVTENAIFIMEDLDEKMNSFGTQTQEMKQLSFDLILKLSETFRNPTLEKFLKKIGKKRALARKGQKKRRKEFQGIQSRQVFSDDLNSITEDEYINLGLGIEQFEIDFYNRYLNARLSTWQGAKVEKKRKGPIIVCYDGSASMEGERIEETKAHLLAFMDIAKKQKRKMLTIQFSSAADELYIVELDPRSGNLQEIVDIIEGFIGKGTDFKKPLIKSLEYIINYGYRDADIIFMTDGESNIEEEFKKEFLHYKEKYKFKMYTILINFQRKEYRDIQFLSDEVYYVYEGIWDEEVSEKIFSI